MPRDLSPKQARFVVHYAESRNETEAALKAGYAKGSAHVSASRLLKKANIRKHVSDHRNAIAEQANITVSKVMREVGILAFSSLGNYFDFDGEGPPLEKPSKEIDKESIRALKSINITEKTTTRGLGDDAETEVTRVVEYTLWDKTAAIEKLAKHFGLFLEAEEVKRMHAELADLLAKAKAGVKQVAESPPVVPGSTEGGGNG